MEESNLYCPWNSFNDCYKRLCPFWGRIGKKRTQDGQTIILYGCRRAEQDATDKERDQK